MKTQNNRLELLDYGRFTAAIAVLLSHYLYNGIRNGKISSISHMELFSEIASYGRFGVEFFFMLSGYVIFFSARNRKASAFLKSRFKRLYPTFWCCLILSSFFIYIWGQETIMKINLKQVLLNFTMIPSLFHQKNVDGVYWTLLWELRFYCLIFLLLLLNFQKKLKHVFILWTFYILTCTYFHKTYLPYSNHNYLYFIAGALFASVNRKNLLIYLISLSICLFLSITNFKLEYNSTKLVIISLFYFFFTLTTFKKIKRIKLYKSKLLGALTYPLYLFHAHFGYLFISRYATENNKIYIYCLTISIVLITSYIINKIIEERLSKFWGKTFSIIVEKPILIFENFLSNIKVSFANNTYKK